MAVNGLDNIGVPICTPKRFHVRRAVRNFEDAGCSFGNGLIELYLSTEAVKRGKVPRMLGLLSVVSLHEMLHDERYNLFPRDDLVEFVATEGIAHYGDTLFARSTLGRQKYHDSIMAARQLITEAQLQALRESLYEDNQVSDDNDAIFELWFEKERAEVLHYPMGVLLGLRCVDYHISAGATLPEMLHWSPEEVVAV
jgi:hypothetical protein